MRSQALKIIVTTFIGGSLGGLLGYLGQCAGST